MVWKKTETEYQGSRINRRRYDIEFGYGDPFIESYQRGGGCEPLIIRGRIGWSLVHKVFVDTGSSSNIMYEECFEKLPEKFKDHMKPPKSTMSGFTGQAVWPRGVILLPISFEDTFIPL